MSFNIEQNGKKRVVIVGGGFGGLKLANKLRGSGLQVVLIDKNNYHQFPPLIYQIASAGIEPSAIAFPFRKMFKHRRDFYYRMAEARAVFPEQKILQTSIGLSRFRGGDYHKLLRQQAHRGRSHTDEDPLRGDGIAQCPARQP